MVSSQENTNNNLLYLFAAAFLIRLWFNFGTDHINCYGVSDASEYLRYATAISKLNFGAPIFGPEWKEFAISGPAFPFFLVLCSALSFSPFEATNSTLFLTAQSAISALTAVFTAWIATKLWNSKTGLLAGYMAAAYPAFIVNTGRLYSETFATFLEVAAMAILLRLFFKNFASPDNHKAKQSIVLLKEAAPYLGLGVVLVLLQLTRSSMILFSAASLILVVAMSLRGQLANWKPALLAGLTVVAGMLVVLGPWFSFQKAAFNKVSPIVDRVGQYNLFIGTNTDTDGFLSYPYPDGRGIEEKSFTTLLKEAFKKSPSRAIKLALDKPARLYKFPWNDMRVRIGPISYQLQVFLHQLIILLSLCGLCLALFVGIKEQTSTNKTVIAARCSLLLLIALNLPYMLFITVPRYNLTAMPAFIILAAAGLTTLLSLLKHEQLAKAPKVAAIAALFLLFYLRDDLRAPFAFSNAQAPSLYVVQGAEAERLLRGLIASIGAIALFAGLYFSTSLMYGAKLWAKIITMVIAVPAVVLCLFAQRANGRPGEGIITIERPGEKLSGQIFVPHTALKETDVQWFLLVDSDKGQLAKQQFDLILNGKKLTTDPISSITSLDDWHYLKQLADKSWYLDCSYIFDCLAQPAGLSNTELRQWFALPIPVEQLAQINRVGYCDVDIVQKSTKPTTFFCAAAKDTSSKQQLNLLPSRTLYSWEKAFYGVENDNGLTDPRYDEKLPLRKGKWTINFDKTSENINMDLNVRLIKVKLDKPTFAHIVRDSVEGRGEATVDINDNLISEGRQLLTANLTKDQEKNNFINSVLPAPEFFVTWENNGHTEKMPLRIMPRLGVDETSLIVSAVADLAQAKGSNFKLHCFYPDRNNKPDKLIQIKLSATSLRCHPLFSPQEIF
ncbi:MAG: hypothetical protein WCT03_04230 [Candidatus Obscuribacterales bacterium]|jgi:hypothetical protein